MSTDTKKFAILLATWNGAEFLREQLNSLAAQSVANMDVWVSDDASTDATLSILENFAVNWTKGQFAILRREQLPGIAKTPIEGSNANFLSLILNCDIEADFYAFCDQDDVWDANKLEVARNWLNNQVKDKPAIYFSRTRIINDKGELTGYSPAFNRPPCFANAIVQNIAAGNTIVLNRAAMELLREYNPRSGFVSHDWWCYLLVTAFGGSARYDHRPTLSYRQHDSNLVGENSSWKSRMTRLGMVLAGRFKTWNAQNRKALVEFEDHLPVSSKLLLEEFDRIRMARGLNAILTLKQSGIHRQTFLGHLGLYFASFIGKI